ncbi:hypothetical protein [Coralliovum pocilloporae]|uniref:hypothetical protein n=1 Tax=Coralliovum pocilloporae TaxID=3066369 RepID=UPI003307744B
MTRAVAALRASREEIASLTDQHYDLARGNRVRTILYPTEVLDQMIALERRRRALFGASDQAMLQAYQTQLETTIKAYLSYLALLRPALVLTKGEQNVSGLEFHLGRSRFDHFLAALDHYARAGEQALETAKARWACVEGTAIDCPEPHWPLLPRPSKSNLDASVLQGDAAHIVSSIRKGSLEGGKPDYPQWVLTTSHQCQPHQPQMAYFLWQFPMPLFFDKTGYGERNKTSPINHASAQSRAGEVFSRLILDTCAPPS